MGAFDKEDLQGAVELLSAAAHPTRLAVLLTLASDGSRSVGELQRIINVEQSAMSHQLRALKRAGLVKSVRDGKHMLYSLVDHHVAHIVQDALAHAIELRQVRS